jgi:hypothetical protein
VEDSREGQPHLPLAIVGALCTFRPWLGRGVHQQRLHRLGGPVGLPPHISAAVQPNGPLLVTESGFGPGDTVKAISVPGIQINNANLSWPLQTVASMQPSPMSHGMEPPANSPGTGEER